MRITGQTNLNLDMTNLAAFPLTKKLERWLRNYPQEIVPICDQVLKECVASRLHTAQADASQLSD
jgi:DNA replication licensing factor MCM4